MKPKKLTKINIFANIVLFIIKVIASIMTNSISIISDTLNTFLDIFTAIISNFAIKISNKKPDKNHNFGHKQAEPISALIISILAAVVGFEIIRNSFFRIITQEDILLSKEAIFLLLFSISIKLIITFLCYKSKIKEQNTVIDAIRIDSRNDVLATSIALIGYVLSYTNYSYFDSIFGLFIGIFILKSSYEMANKNVKFLMGEKPKKESFNEIKKIIKNNKFIKGIEYINAKYDGTDIFYEIKIVLNGNLTTFESHSILKGIKEDLECKKKISKVFISIKPI